MPRAPANTSPIVTLLSDFGLRDSYVAEMKLALLRHTPRASLIDATHQIDPQDVLGGSFALQRTVAAAMPGTFHLGVVDPGVGSTRRILAAIVAGQTIICPDNGLITWAWHRLGPGEAYELTWRPAKSSTTFHGRDIMAPAIGMLAAGTRLAKLTRPIDDPVLLDIRPAEGRVGRVIHIDHFGNASTNILAESLGGRLSVKLGRRNLGPVRRAYSDVARGKIVALIGSSGLLEIAVRDGSAARQLSLKIGDEVMLVS